MVHPKTGRVYIASKNEDGGHLYEGPPTLSAAGRQHLPADRRRRLWVTDGAFSPGRHAGWCCAATSAASDVPLERTAAAAAQGSASLSVPLQRQGESVTFTPGRRRADVRQRGRAEQRW